MANDAAAFATAETLGVQINVISSDSDYIVTPRPNDGRLSESICICLVDDSHYCATSSTNEQVKNGRDVEGHDLHDGNECGGDKHDGDGSAVSVRNVTLMLRGLPLLKSRHYLSLTVTLTTVTDVDDSFKETLRTAHDDGTLRAILKDSKIVTRTFYGFRQLSNLISDRHSDFFSRL